jgi:hypothetical protein
MSDRLVRETNPPEGRIASPTPQYWNPILEAYEKAEGVDGAIFTDSPRDRTGYGAPTYASEPEGYSYLDADAGDLYFSDGTQWVKKLEGIWA